MRDVQGSRRTAASISTAARERPLRFDEARPVMSQHHATIAWERAGRDFDYESYSRNHTWDFECGTEVVASAASAFRGDPGKVNPEDAYVAALSSCHMLTFLAIAARTGIVVERYYDAAVGYLERNEDGKLAMTRVVLRPEVTFQAPVPASDLAQMHERAHEDCFIASSVRTLVTVEIVRPVEAGAETGRQVEHGD
jgi:organic hydroperoxide reductase OsmC/OhrA